MQVVAGAGSPAVPTHAARSGVVEPDGFTQFAVKAVSCVAAQEGSLPGKRLAPIIPTHGRGVEKGWFDVNQLSTVRSKYRQKRWRFRQVEARAKLHGERLGLTAETHDAISGAPINPRTRFR